MLNTGQDLPKRKSRMLISKSTGPNGLTRMKKIKQNQLVKTGTMKI